MGRTIAIGDVHGCSHALKVLLGTIQTTPRDQIIFLGDLIDYGPDSRGVLDLVNTLAARTQVIVIAGNHEAMLLDGIDGRLLFDNWLHHGGRETLASYGFDDPSLIPHDHLARLRSGLRFHETETHLFVHANYLPNLPLAETPGSVLSWECCDPRTSWPHFSGKTVILGHTPQVNGMILDLGFLVGIDTDASRGGWLTALDAESGEWWQTNQIAQVRTGRRHTGRKDRTP